MFYRLKSFIQQKYLSNQLKRDKKSNFKRKTEFNQNGFEYIFFQSKQTKSLWKSDDFITKQTPIWFYGKDIKNSYTGFGTDIVYVIKKSSGKIVSRKDARSFFQKMEKYGRGHLEGCVEKNYYLVGASTFEKTIDGYGKLKEQYNWEKAS